MWGKLKIDRLRFTVPSGSLEDAVKLIAEAVGVALSKPICPTCGKEVPQSRGQINRAKKTGRPIFCNRVCFGKSRRMGKTAEQKKEEKRLYDINYRATSPTLKQRKAAYYQRTKDPAKEAVKRKLRAPQHAEYCRRPEYKAKKKVYDQHHRAEKFYGEFAEAAIALFTLETEVAERIERTDIYAANGTLNKKQTRRRIYEQQGNCNP